MVPSTSLSLKLFGSCHALNFGMSFWKKNLKMGAFTKRLNFDLMMVLNNKVGGISTQPTFVDYMTIYPIVVVMFPSKSPWLILWGTLISVGNQSSDLWDISVLDRSLSWLSDRTQTCWRGCFWTPCGGNPWGRWLRSACCSAPQTAAPTDPRPRSPSRCWSKLCERTQETETSHPEHPATEPVRFYRSRCHQLIIKSRKWEWMLVSTQQGCSEDTF